jgi:hypothetical protein
MITVKEFVNPVTAKRANNIFLLIHYLQRKELSGGGIVNQMTKMCLKKIFISPALVLLSSSLASHSSSFGSLFSKGLHATAQTILYVFA